MTNYIKEKDIDDNAISEIAESIRKGQIVVFKTDTVYGMGASAFDGDACKRIYDIKGRPLYKPLVMLISDVSMLDEIVESITPIEQKLMDTFWPGALTIKFRKKKNVLPDIVSAGDDFVRVRLIKEGLAYNLIKASNVPIVAPSANLSGSKTGTKIEAVTNELGGKVDYILDGGNVNNDITSTIVEVKNEEVIIIREGKIKKEDIEQVVPLKKEQSNLLQKRRIL